jgi:hypothetical protein
VILVLLPWGFYGLGRLLGYSLVELSQFGLELLEKLVLLTASRLVEDLTSGAKDLFV